MKNYLKLIINDVDNNDLSGFEIASIIDEDSFLNNLTFKPTNPFVLNDKEKFYFLPGVTIPRVKLKDLYSKNKAKTVRDIEDATKIILGSQSKDTLAKFYWMHSINKESLKTILETIYSNQEIDSLKYQNMKDALDIYTEDIILGDYSLYRLCIKHGLKHGIECSYGSDRYYIINEDYENLISKIDVNLIYNENDLIDLVNGNESTTIDIDMYNTLSEMFKSSDDDNHVLAMEIMANTNYKESLLYLCMLFEEFSNIISNEKTKNHVNFKSLTKYMNFSSPSYCSMTKDDIVDLLIARDVFTKEIGLELLRKYKSEIDNRGDSKYFKISRITFDDVVMNYLTNKSNPNELNNPE